MKLENRPTTESLDRYLSEIGSAPLLDREEEAGLARRIREGDRLALEALIASNLRFVVSIAKRYKNRGVALADLVNEGNLGLIRAAERFDETRGVRFVSYAIWWIRQAILQAIAEQSNIVHVPAARSAEASRITRGRRQLQQDLGREPTAEELAIELDLPLSQIREALATPRGYVSLDATVQGSQDMKLAEFLADERGDNPDGRTERGALRDALDSSLTRLPEREQTILRLYFGLDREKGPVPLEEIARQLGVSRERVRQLKDHALCRLRNGAPARYLQGFVD